VKKLPLNIGVIHFIGIGGIGMSGIAEALHHLGYQIQGSDVAKNANVIRLQKLGIHIHIGHHAHNIHSPDSNPVAAVVRSSAVNESNVEVKAARKHQIPVIRRAEMLAELMRFKWSIAVGGTHGKTTTTSLVGHILEQAHFDPTIINGGIINSYGSNTRLGKGDWMVVEADESDGTFTHLPAIAGIITNIEAEHMEHYGSFDKLQDAFKQFVSNIPFYGVVAVCTDDPEIENLIPEFTRPLITYGLKKPADLQAINIKTDTNGLHFDLKISHKINATDEILNGFFLPMYGQHNIANSLAALAIGHKLDIPFKIMREALKNFEGIKRRFTQTGCINGITIIDDYGHHPTEINAVLKAARDIIKSQGHGKVIAVMQPHRYSRLAHLFDDFCHCFSQASHIIISEVFAAGETLIKGATQNDLIQGIKKTGQNHVSALDSPENLAAEISQIAQEGDFVICLGAGSITQWANALPDELDKILNTPSKTSAL